MFLGKLYSTSKMETLYCVLLLSIFIMAQSLAYTRKSSASDENQTNVFNGRLDANTQEDADLLVPDLIQKYGYPCSTHVITTTDQYILEMHRIPYGTNGPTENRSAVFLVHGLLGSSADWVVAGPGKGLGYILADAGYDVWMPNVRGTRYSRKHVTLDPSTNAKKFWNFSWHEMALDDIPTLIDYVLAATNQSQVYYIGHSQGTTIFYVLCAEKPEYNDKIKVQFSLAPMGYMGHIFSPILRSSAFFHGPLETLFSILGLYEFLPNSEVIRKAGEVLYGPIEIRSSTLFVMAGYNPKQMNATLLPVIMGHSPAGSSTKQILHYAQEVHSGKFRQYHYGFIQNLKQYSSINPPKYDLKKVRAPVYLFYSHNDWLSADKDVWKLYNELGNVKERFLVPDFAHLDYVFGIDAPNLIYLRLLQLMKSY